MNLYNSFSIDGDAQSIWADILSRALSWLACISLYELMEARGGHAGWGESL